MFGLPFPGGPVKRPFFTKQKLARIVLFWECCYVLLRRYASTIFSSSFYDIVDYVDKYFEAIALKNKLSAGADLHKRTSVEVENF